jgi:DNA repair exonuclease SbcCD nuclease subunit
MLNWRCMLKFLHIADLHLGMRVTRFPPDAVPHLQNARLDALKNVRTELRNRDAGYQFVIVAGDLFDDACVSANIAERARDMLLDFPVPVLVISGNHDPLQEGTVWDNHHWQSISAAGPGCIRLFRERAPVEVLSGVTVFPCPVFRKTSTENPTEWIRNHPRGDNSGYRIGIAHGSVMDRPNLPEDDHPIAPTAPTDLQLDYLALGHWHNYREFRDTAGNARMIYPGVHEPMRFSGEADSSGWRPYSSGTARDEFLDQGLGTAVSVTIAAPGAPPEISSIRVGYLTWDDRQAIVNGSEDLSKLISETADRPEKEKTLLRLRLSGVIPLDALAKLDHLRDALKSYVVGEIDDRALVVEPTEDEIRAAIGQGVLKTVYDQLQTRAASADAAESETARRATRLLYQLTRVG